MRLHDIQIGNDITHLLTQFTYYLSPEFVGEQHINTNQNEV